MPFLAEEAFLYLLFEHQSTPDRDLPLRLLRYVVRIWEHFRSGAGPGPLLPPVVPVVLDALPEGGGIVRLAPGRFEITRPLIVRTPETRLEGAGAATHIVNQNTEGKPALHLRPDDYPKNSRSRVWRVQLGNFRISGNAKSGDGVLAEGINEIFVHGLSVDHHGGHGINLVNCYEDPRIADSILTYNGGAGLNIVGGHDIVVSANQFSGIDGQAVRCDDRCERILITGNIATDTGRRAEAGAAFARPADEASVVKDNIVR